MTVLDMNPATLPAPARALYETMAYCARVRYKVIPGIY
jgi:hypothetical protein